MIIISGASRGIGKFLKESFEKVGHKVIGTYNTALNSADSTMFRVNIADYLQVKEWIDSLTLDDKIVLINCAGTNYNALAHKADIAEWNNVIDVNIKGTFNLIHELLPHMRTKKYGRIINLSSVVGQIGIVGTSCYAASKSALSGLTRSIAVENAKNNVTINNINLGYFNIGMIKEVPDEYLKGIQQRIPSGKLGTPEDIFKTVRYMIETEYVNGTSIDVNGGLY